MAARASPSFIIINLFGKEGHIMAVTSTDVNLL